MDQGFYSEKSEKHKAEIQRAWNILDQNGDNQVNARELVRGARLLGINPTLQEAKKMIADVDENRLNDISSEVPCSGIFRTLQIATSFPIDDMSSCEPESYGFILFDKMLSKLFTGLHEKNGYIGLEEFDAMMTQYYDVLDYQEHEIREAFKRFDTEGKGFLNRKQLKRALKNIGDQLTEEECEEFFNLTDTNHDGKIDIEEFVVLFTAT